jgi:hypothetical protein
MAIAPHLECPEKAGIGLILRGPSKSLIAEWAIVSYLMHTTAPLHSGMLQSGHLFSTSPTTFISRRVVHLSNTCSVLCLMCYRKVALEESPMLQTSMLCHTS